jgi:hypothetical protein
VGCCKNALAMVDRPNKKDQTRKTRKEPGRTSRKYERKKNSPKQQSQSASDIDSKPYYCDHSSLAVFF